MSGVPSSAAASLWSWDPVSALLLGCLVVGVQALQGTTAILFRGAASLQGAGRAGWGSHSLRGLPTPTPFQFRGNIPASLGDTPIPPPSPPLGWFLQESDASGKTSPRVKMSKGNFCFYESQTPLKQGTEHEVLSICLEEGKERYWKAKQINILKNYLTHLDLGHEGKNAVSA